MPSIFPTTAIITLLYATSSIYHRLLLSENEFSGNGSYDLQLMNNGEVLVSDESLQTTFPSVVRIPDWMEDRADPSANYYLYYCNHRGFSIYMKWAASIDGPWHTFDLGGSYVGGERKGVFDIEADITRVPYEHIAAPDVHVDNKRRMFVLYYHGRNQPTEITSSGIKAKRHHETFVATSRDGLNFNDPLHAGGQEGYGPKTVTIDDATRDVCITNAYLRYFEHGKYGYGLTKRGVIFKTPEKLSRDIYAPNPEDPFGIQWTQATTPTELWTSDAFLYQSEYFSPPASFLASDEFANHKNNPVPGTRVLSESRGARLNHLSVFELPDDKLEVFFYIKSDDDDVYNDLYRVVMDISDEDFEKWDMQRDEDGEVIFEVVVTPEQIREAVEIANPEGVNPETHAYPASLGSSFIFLDDDDSKYLFLAYANSSEEKGESEGMITYFKLIPK